MATDEQVAYSAVVGAVGAVNWAGVLDGIAAAEAWLRSATPGDPRIDELVLKLTSLASHSKWEVRRGIANIASQVHHPAFERALMTLVTDDNTRVRQAAENAALRRRDWQNASTLGKQHEDRINSTLDDIEVRFGRRGREAVKRASEQIANTFARELYHEVIKLLSPLAMSADRLQTRLANESTKREDLIDEAARIAHRVTRLRAVIDGMRAYTAQPKLTFAWEPLKDVIEESVALVREAEMDTKCQPPIEVRVEASVSGEVSRARLVQALTNILANAIESYDGLDVQSPIVVRAEAEEGRVVISVEDSGCGMSAEVLSDAIVLFATSKEGGTGFGLPLAVKIVESEHAGRLNLESVKGRGTIVRVTIPAQRHRDIQ